MPLFSVSENQGYSKELSEELLLIQFMLKVSENRKGKKPATQQTFLVFQDVFNVTLFIFQDVFKYLQYVFLKRLQNVFKTSSRRLARRLQGIFKTYSRHPARRLQDAFNTSSRRVCKTSCNYVFKTSRRQKNVTLKTSSRRLQYVFTKTNVCWEDSLSLLLTSWFVS